MADPIRREVNPATVTTEFNILFKYLRDDGLWVWLNKTELFNDVQVSEGEEQNIPVSLGVPNDAKLHSFSVHVYISLKTENSSNIGYLESITTNIVRETRIELQHEIDLLKTQLADVSLTVSESSQNLISVLVVIIAFFITTTIYFKKVNKNK